MTFTGPSFCAGIMETNTEQQEGTGMNLYRNERHADIMEIPP